MELCKVTLKELFSVNNYLEYGYPVYVKYAVPKDFRDDVIEKMDLNYTRINGYHGDADKIFNYFKEKYPDRIKSIGVDDYSHLLAKAKMTFKYLRF